MSVWWKVLEVAEVCLLGWLVCAVIELYRAVDAHCMRIAKAHERMDHVDNRCTINELALGSDKADLERLRAKVERISNAER